MIEDLIVPISEHARRFAPQECCGVIVRSSDGSSRAVECPNVYEFPTAGFRIASKDYESFLRAGTLIGFYHSHVLEDEMPSAVDIATSESAKLPVLTYSLHTGKLHVYTPTGAASSLEGRSFFFGVFDCVGLVIDYYDQKLGIKLPPCPRTITDMRQGFANLGAYLALSGMVPIKEPRKNGIVGMSFNANNALDHVGIYLGDGWILQHLVNHQSKKMVYGSRWTDHTIGHWIHSSLL